MKWVTAQSCPQQSAYRRPQRVSKTNKSHKENPYGKMQNTKNKGKNVQSHRREKSHRVTQRDH